MNREQLDPFAQYLVGGYLDAASYSRQFSDEFGTPPTNLSKVHHMRSVVQARLTEDERFELDGEWADFGRVQWTDLSTGQSYILRSQSAIRIESEIRGQATLFNPDQYVTTTDVAMVVYTFNRSGVDLSLTNAVQKANGRRLEPAGQPRDIGRWLFAEETAAAFDQQTEDAFDDLGDIDVESLRKGR